VRISFGKVIIERLSMRFKFASERAGERLTVAEAPAVFGKEIIDISPAISPRRPIRAALGSVIIILI
jgi:hypothetical protein